MATREAIDTMIDDSESGASVSEVFEESGGLSKSEEDPTDSVVKYKYKPRPLTPEDREKLVVEQAELLAFFTLLYSTTALAIAVRLMTKDDEEQEFQKGVCGFMRRYLFMIARTRPSNQMFVSLFLPSLTHTAMNWPIFAISACKKLFRPCFPWQTKW